jgi:predicted phosphodiesterase
MTVAALYDVHGNLPALEAVLADPRLVEAETVVCGGDLVAGPLGAECLDAMLALGDRVRFVRGNGERNVLARRPEHGSAWCADRLGDARLRELAGWPLTCELEVAGLERVLFCHATPRSDEEIVTRITPESAVAEALMGTSADVVVCGHTHVQFDRRIGALRLVNAGSVGLPYEGRQGAFWALVTGDGVDLLETGYDVEHAARLMRASGSPVADEHAHLLLHPEDPVEVTSHFEGLRGA